MHNVSCRMLQGWSSCGDWMGDGGYLFRLVGRGLKNRSSFGRDHVAGNRPSVWSIELSGFPGDMSASQFVSDSSGDLLPSGTCN